MSIESKYEELIESSYKELETLRSEVTQLEDIRKNIEILIGSNAELPSKFLELYKKLKEISESYIIGINEITRGYLTDANTIFIERIGEFQLKIDALEIQIKRLVNTNFSQLFEDLQKVFIDRTRADLEVELKKFDEKSKDLHTKIGELKKQIERLVNTDFTKLFKDLQKVFIDQSRADLEVELKKFDEKSKDLHTKIGELKKQIERLEKIDLAKHFDKLQKTLAEIFGAINAINLTLTNIVQTLTGIVQSLGTIQTTLDINHKEAKQLLTSFSETTEKHFTDQDNHAKKNVELLESKIKSVSEQNELLRKEVKTNRIIQIVGLTIILIILIYVAVK